MFNRRTLGLSLLAFGMVTGCGRSPNEDTAQKAQQALSPLSRKHIAITKLGTPRQRPELFLTGLLSDGGVPQTDAGTLPSVDGGSVTEIPTLTIPQVVSAGGPVLSAPHVTTVTFRNDVHTGAVANGSPTVENIDTFVQFLGAEPIFWDPTLEFQVRAGTTTPTVHLNEDAPALVDEFGVSVDPNTHALVPSIETWLAEKLNGTHPEFGVPDENTLYAFFYPATTTITIGAGATSCNYFGAYHSNIVLPTSERFPNGLAVAYAIIPRCAPNSSSAMDFLTEATSHEFAEAATDPYPYTAPAFSSTDADHIAFSWLAGGGEIGDMCEFENPVGYYLGNSNFWVQKSWSNVEALARRNPCVPSPGAPYFNAGAVVSDRFSLTPDISTLGVKVPVGSSVTVPVSAFASPGVSSWTLGAVDVAKLFGGQSELQLCFSTTPTPTATCQSVITAQAGQPLYLTVTSKVPSQTLGLPGVGGFILVNLQGDQYHYWYDLVHN